MEAIGTSTTVRKLARWVAAASSMLLVVLAATAALATTDTEPIQPPDPVEAVGAVSCTPRTPLAGETLTCTATGAEGLAELDVRLFHYSPARGPEEEGVLWRQDALVPVEDGVATFAFTFDEHATEGDTWEAYASGIGGSQQDCYVIERETGLVVATGALESELMETVVVDGETVRIGAESFQVGGEIYSANDYSLVCTDEIRYDAGDAGLIGAAPEPGDEPAPPPEEPAPPDEDPVPPDEQPAPPPAVPDDTTEQAGTETEAPPVKELDDDPPLAATGVALVLLLLGGVLAVGGGIAILRC